MLVRLSQKRRPRSLTGNARGLPSRGAGVLRFGSTDQFTGSVGHS
jgi:hypothetical protein